MPSGYALVCLALWAGLIVAAGYFLLQPVPPMGPAGMLLAAAAPLAYLLWVLTTKPAQTQAHPVMISVISGFGVVMTMVNVQRFGDDHQAFVLGAVTALATWLVHVRWFSGRKRDP
jgi:hypothetical protein